MPVSGADNSKMAFMTSHCAVTTVTRHMVKGFGRCN